MNELRVFSYNDVDVVYSRDVAEMIRRPHNDLMKSIRAYCDYLGQGDFSQSDFFIPSTYINSQNKEQPCYLLTKKGCDMVANKMTGEKGVLFTAAYVTAFEKMREHIQGSKVKRVGMTDYQQMMAETRRRNARVQAARILTQLAKQYHGTTYEQVLNAHATKELTGEYLLPLPKLDAKTYSAAEIGEMLGISSNKVGTLTNRNNLKTDQYGQWFKDKVPNINKEVPCFRYYETVIPVLRDLLQAETA
ncbi:MAG: Rha family transcriptional regulator [Dialister sp.]|uniref:Rha family transcriptional regulator n=1 Tax=Dialister sp. TaxID=1955814 RepID=UPI001D84955F|nr:Rha family transcriptional regulator [Dialister sp.]MBS6715354.1 Rha family transcriptional regulator [Dialister sp.]